MRFAVAVLWVIGAYLCVVLAGYLCWRFLVRRQDGPDQR